MAMHRHLYPLHRHLFERLLYALCITVEGMHSCSPCPLEYMEQKAHDGVGTDLCPYARTQQEQFTASETGIVVADHGLNGGFSHRQSTRI